MWSRSQKLNPLKQNGGINKSWNDYKKILPTRPGQAQCLRVYKILNRKSIFWFLRIKYIVLPEQHEMITKYTFQNFIETLFLFWIKAFTFCEKLHTAQHVIDNQSYKQNVSITERTCLTVLRWIYPIRDFNLFISCWLVKNKHKSLH